MILDINTYVRLGKILQDVANSAYVVSGPNRPTKHRWTAEGCVRSKITAKNHFAFRKGAILKVEDFFDY